MNDGKEDDDNTNDNKSNDDKDEDDEDSNQKRKCNYNSRHHARRKRPQEMDGIAQVNQK